MTRKFLIINQSPTMRKIVRSKIRANIDDAMVYEAENTKEAITLIHDHQCHLAIYLWDGIEPEELQFFQKLENMPERKKISSFLMTTSDQEGAAEKIKEAGIEEYLYFPCPSLQLAETLNRVCNPVTLRRSERYAFQDTLFLLEQRGRAFEGNVVNASLGGMLCEMPFSDDFNWSFPANASINFNIEGESIIAPHLYSTVVQITVTRRHPDFSPKMLRVSFKFLQVPDATHQALERVFARVQDIHKISEENPAALAAQA